MFIELVDALRCPRLHEETWLVLAASRIEARHIREGTLGCPVCRAEYPIRDGIADFRDTDTVGGDGQRSATAPRANEASSLVDAEQLAAMMNLGDALGFAVLVGAWGRRAEDLLDLIDAPPLLLVDPPEGIVMRAGLSGVRCDRVLPLAIGAARAVAVDEGDAVRVEASARATRVGGRMVAPASVPVPLGVRELARDETVWVGEREASASGLVSLHVPRG